MCSVRRFLNVPIAKSQIRSLQGLNSVFRICLPLFLAIWLGGTGLRAQPQAETPDFERWLDHAVQLMPEGAKGYASLETDKLQAAAAAIDQWCAEITRVDPRSPPEAVLEVVERL